MSTTRREKVLDSGEIVDAPVRRRRRRPWLPWLMILALLAVVAGLVQLLLSSNSSQKALEGELELQRQAIESMRAEAENKEREEKGRTVITNSAVSAQLSSIRELAVTEYLYTNAGKYENNNQVTIIGQNVDIPFTGKRFIVAYDGRITAGVDLGQAEVAVDEDARAVTVTLPASRITSHETYEDTLVVLDETNNLFNPIKLENYSAFVNDQKAAMEQKAMEQGLLTNADEEARAAVKAVLSLLPGMEDYTLAVK